MNTEKLINYFEKKYNKNIIEFDYIKWIEISHFEYLTEKFMEKYENKLSWTCISRYQKLSEEFIEKFKNKVDWHLISCYQKLSGEFMEKYKNNINWTWISICQNLSGEFIHKYKNKIHLNILFKQNKINYLQYQAKNNIISNSEYLKEILKLRTE